MKTFRVPEFVVGRIEGQCYTYGISYRVEKGFFKDKYIRRGLVDKENWDGTGMLMVWTEDQERILKDRQKWTRFEIGNTLIKQGFIRYRPFTWWYDENTREYVIVQS